jgi:hypothetical protein
MAPDSYGHARKAYREQFLTLWSKIARSLTRQVSGPQTQWSRQPNPALRRTSFLCRVGIVFCACMLALFLFSGLSSGQAGRGSHRKLGKHAPSDGAAARLEAGRADGADRKLRVRLPTIYCMLHAACACVRYAVQVSRVQRTLARLSVGTPMALCH